jgi:Spy/CpxP family protein refolding chaperone
VPIKSARSHPLVLPLISISIREDKWKDKEPLVSADQPDEATIVAQIDKVARARAEQEKANARMLLGIRRLLIPEQWNRLKSETPATPQPVRR